MERVMVIGCGGAGKSTFAKKLGAILRLPVVHLDACHWHAGWQPTPPDKWRDEVQALIEKPRWVIDGNYGGTMDQRLARCDAVIFLDLPRVVCLWRALKRQLRYAGRTRPDMALGCPERMSLQFIGWIWNYRSTRREGILRKLAALRPEQRAIVLTSPAAVRRFLDETRFLHGSPE